MRTIFSMPIDTRKEIEIRLSISKHNGKYEIRIANLPDIDVLANDCDELTVIAKLDASRFRPKIIFGTSQRLR